MEVCSYFQNVLYVINILWDRLARKTKVIQLELLWTRTNGLPVVRNGVSNRGDKRLIDRTEFSWFSLYTYCSPSFIYFRRQKLFKNFHNRRYQMGFQDCFVIFGEISLSRFQVTLTMKQYCRSGNQNPFTFEIDSPFHK